MNLYVVKTPSGWALPFTCSTSRNGAINKYCKQLLVLRGKIDHWPYYRRLGFSTAVFSEVIK